jgi:malate permease and related proteins
MEVFYTLLVKLIPLYLIILLGFIASKKLKAQKETISAILIYIIAPVVIFAGTSQAELNLAILSLPLVFFLTCCLFCFIFYYFGKYFYPDDSTRNILAFTAGTGNTGYFGLPVTLMLFGEQAFSIAVLAILGFILYENTLGFFITARGHHTASEALMKVIKLPTIYAFLLGILVNYLQLDLGLVVQSTVDLFKGAYSVLGMMIIGMGLAGVSLSYFDKKFLGLSFFAKFIIWPLFIFGIILLDRSYLNFFNEEIYEVMLLMSIVPLAANTVALATELKVQPEKAAIAVMLSTMFALIFIPLVSSIAF